MSDSTNLQLPYLDGAQAQKHVTVNEGLRRLDALVLLAVEDKDLTAPPGSPADGSRYIPKATATGVWSGKENYVAHYVDGAWEFYPPREGFIAYMRDEDQLYVHDGSAWVTLEHALDGDLKTIADLSPANDDIVQRKSGAWTNRTMAQLAADLAASFTTLAVTGPVRVGSSTVSGLPSANPAGQVLYVSNESGGAVIAFSDGTNWRRVTDRAVVS
ncbi:MAG TPA: DUF2793 domain-containing protein [Micropepsaceae bacterium]|jgi:hypothetical protein|nr:DUF2793 domain-containing protein [Micropepsaceae bacterium]